jgi:hypothetical protein
VGEDECALQKGARASRGANDGVLAAKRHKKRKGTATTTVSREAFGQAQAKESQEAQESGNDNSNNNGIQARPTTTMLLPQTCGEVGRTMSAETRRWIPKGTGNLESLTTETRKIWRGLWPQPNADCRMQSAECRVTQEERKTLSFANVLPPGNAENGVHGFFSISAQARFFAERSIPRPVR